MTGLGVSLVTNGRNPELLAFAVRRWGAAGAKVVAVVSREDTLDALSQELARSSEHTDNQCVGALTDPHGRPGFWMGCGWEGRDDTQVVFQPADVEPSALGRARQVGVRALIPCGVSAILHTDDDVLPLTDVGQLRLTPPDCLQAVKLIGVTGGRWFDWAVHENGVSREQPYDEHAPGTYVTLASQCVGADLAKQLDYGTCGGFRMKQDVRYSQRAAKLGKLLPPKGDVVLLHLDRK